MQHACRLSDACCFDSITYNSRTAKETDRRENRHDTQNLKRTAGPRTGYLHQLVDGMGSYCAIKLSPPCYGPSEHHAHSGKAYPVSAMGGIPVRRKTHPSPPQISPIWQVKFNARALLNDMSVQLLIPAIYFSLIGTSFHRLWRTRPRSA